MSTSAASGYVLVATTIVTADAEARRAAALATLFAGPAGAEAPATSPAPPDAKRPRTDDGPDAMHADQDEPAHAPTDTVL
jgi:hypothetical protein